MISAQQLDALDPPTRQAMLSLMAEIRAKDALIAQRDREAAFKQALIDKLTHEMAVLKRLKFAATSERFASTLAPEQKSLLEETLDTDLAELEREIEREQGLGDDKAKDKTGKKTPKRTPLPPHLPRHDVPHEPADTHCGCGQSMQRFGEDVAERLDYQPGVFSVERHVRGKWACRCCEKIVQAPVPAHVIDKGIPTAGLLAHLLVAKFMDHLPLYRQEHIFERAGHLISRSTLAQWIGECGAQLQPLVQALADELRRHVVMHADETPVAMLKPAHLRDGKTHRAYIWSYCTTSANPTKAVVFEFSEGRGGENVREFLQLDTPQAWQGTLVTDGFSGYTACFDKGVTSAQCMAHARRKFNDLWANHRSQVGRKALRYHQCLFRIEREIEALPSGERRAATHPATQVTPGVGPLPPLAAGAAATGATRFGHDEGHRLQPQALEGTHPLRRGRRRADLEQLGGEPHPADCHRQVELVVRRQPAGGQAGRGHHEPAALGAHQRA